MATTRLALVATVAVLLAGCASAPPAGSPATGLTEPAYTLLLGPGRSDEQALDRAELVLTGRCMRDRGLPYPVRNLTDTVDVDREWRPDLARRAERGYRIGESLAERPLTGVDAYVAGLPGPARTRYTTALSGSTRASADLAGVRVTYPVDGCAAVARAQLYGDPGTAVAATVLPQRVLLSLQDDLVRRPEWAAAVRGWAACMAGRGFPYRDFAAARAAVAAGYRTAPARAPARELAVASADGRCVFDSGLAATAERLLRPAASALPAGVLAELDRLAAARAGALGRAGRPELSR